MMNRLLLLLLVLLGGCASTPEPDPLLARQATPRQAAEGVQALKAGDRLVWSGTVRSVHNLRDRTEMEIVSYPVSRQRQPIRDMPTTGLFVLEMRGFLEPAEFPTGLAVTAVGQFAGFDQYRRGGAMRRIPRLKGEKLDVWSTERPAKRSRPDVRWGFSIGTGGSGMGVSIGL